MATSTKRGAVTVFALIVLSSATHYQATATNFESHHLNHWASQPSPGLPAPSDGSELKRPSSLELQLNRPQEIQQRLQAPHVGRNAQVVRPPNNQAPGGLMGPQSSSWPDTIKLSENSNQLIEHAHSQHQQKLSKRISGGAEESQANNRAPINLNHQDASLSASLELALRQASGDESVFQPSPAMGATGHDSFDWNAKLAQPDGKQLPPVAVASSNNHRANSAALGNLGESLESNLVPNASVHEQQLQQQATAAAATVSPALTTSSIVASTTPATTTELNNHVSSNQVEPVVLNHYQSIMSHHQRDFVGPANTSLEFNNQVIHEGPATPPSAASADDYYFPSSERTANKELGNGVQNAEASHSNAWWALGLADELERASNLTRDNYLDYCDRSPLLINNKQRSLCRLHPRVLAVVGRGLRMAMDECQAKFSTSRWNCSLIVHGAGTGQPSSLAGDPSSDQPAVFGAVMRRPNRERSFLNAIIAAGLAHSMTKACSQGELPEECSCDRKIKSKNNRGRVEWVACSDDIDYGARFSREFTDNFDPNESEAVATTYMHNSEVGRRVFKSATDITCTCLVGSAGLCQTKRCWKHLGSYADVVDELIKRYEGATHVQRSNKDPHKLRPVRRGVRKPKRKDLVYIEESPDYCRQDTRSGVLGTQNRLCNSTSHGSDSCSLLCCGRGFQSVVEQIEEDCNCKFVWCCQVKCDKCKRFVTNDICN